MVQYNQLDVVAEAAGCARDTVLPRRCLSALLLDGKEDIRLDNPWMLDPKVVRFAFRHQDRSKISSAINRVLSCWAAVCSHERASPAEDE